MIGARLTEPARGLRQGWVSIPMGSICGSRVDARIASFVGTANDAADLARTHPRDPSAAFTAFVPSGMRGMFPALACRNPSRTSCRATTPLLTQCDHLPCEYAPDVGRINSRL
jgi:hypothetical protein